MSIQQTQEKGGIRWAAVLPLLVFLLVTAFFVWGLMKGNPRNIPSVLIGKPAPTFDLPALAEVRAPNGQPVGGLSTAELKTPGIKLVNFFASWCLACRDEHPFLLALAARKEMPIYGIAYKDQPEKTRAWLAEMGGNPYERIGVDLKGRVGIDFGVYGVPETYFIDERGVIVYKYIGPLSEKAWREQVLPALKKARAQRQRQQNAS